MKSAVAFVLLAFGGCFSQVCAQIAPDSDNARDTAAPAPPQTYGRIDGDTYISPTGLYRMKIPVVPQLGGAIADTPNLVNFDDDFSIHISVAAFPLTPELKAEFEKRGIKDFLIYFFTSFIMPDYAARFPGSKMEENAAFLSKFQGGAMIIYTLHPGGSYFEQRVTFSRWLPPAVAKRGNLCFVKDGHIFVLSTELAERVLERSTYRKTPEEENAILHQRLLDLVEKMQFAGPPPPEAKN